MMEKIRRSLLAGIITIIPIALTVYVLQAILILIFTIGGKIAEPLNQIESLKNFNKIINCLLESSIFQFLQI